MLLLIVIIVVVCEDLHNGVACIPTWPRRPIFYLGASRRVIAAKAVGARRRKMGRFPPLLRSDRPRPIAVEAVSVHDRLPGTEVVGAEQEGATATAGDGEVKAAVGAGEEGTWRSGEEEEESGALGKGNRRRRSPGR
ncbi:hypothetical protein E2562_004862 [Oryza meyeriana var. granulata]|uniref:DUF834 domain-containing protein n=1 Tax=Oryza meyeriana var. granulata TaxID=110450 RepID=A0A6G1C3U4_9ORYZ|nr:hypothetical protein E2562_004862 [Oryza meyeriana var. granulata]